MKTSVQFSTPQKPSEFLSHQPSRKSQSPNPFPEHVTKQEIPEQAPTLAGRGHFPKELLSIDLENNSLCSLHSLQQHPNSPWIRRILLNSNQKMTITRGHIWLEPNAQIWALTLLMKIPEHISWLAAFLIREKVLHELVLLETQNLIR